MVEFRKISKRTWCVALKFLIDNLSTFLPGAGQTNSCFYTSWEYEESVEVKKERSAMHCTYSAFAMMLGDGERGGGGGACHKVFHSVLALLVLQFTFSPERCCSHDESVTNTAIVTSEGK